MGQLPNLGDRPSREPDNPISGALLTRRIQVWRDLKPELLVVPRHNLYSLADLAARLAMSEKLLCASEKLSMSVFGASIQMT